MQEREGGAALAPGHAVLVVGAGAMGRGIALVAASAGHLVFLSDVSEEARRRALTASSPSKCSATAAMDCSMSRP